MAEEIMDSLEMEIQDEINSISCTNPGSPERKNAVDSVAKLYAIAIDNKKIDLEDGRELDAKNRELDIKERELDVREAELKDNKIFKILEVGASVLIVAVQVGASCYWMAKGMKFEETGTYSSTVSRGLMSKFIRFLK